MNAQLKSKIESHGDLILSVDERRAHAKYVKAGVAIILEHTEKDDRYGYINSWKNGSNNMRNAIFDDLGDEGIDELEDIISSEIDIDTINEKIEEALAHEDTQFSEEFEYQVSSNDDNLNSEKEINHETTSQEAKNHSGHADITPSDLAKEDIRQKKIANAMSIIQQSNHLGNVDNHPDALSIDDQVNTALKKEFRSKLPTELDSKAVVTDEIQGPIQPKIYQADINLGEKTQDEIELERKQQAWIKAREDGSFNEKILNNADGILEILNGKDFEKKARMFMVIGALKSELEEMIGESVKQKGEKSTSKLQDSVGINPQAVGIDFQTIMKRNEEVSTQKHIEEERAINTDIVKKLKNDKELRYKTAKPEYAILKEFDMNSTSTLVHTSTSNGFEKELEFQRDSVVVEHKGKDYHFFSQIHEMQGFAILHGFLIDESGKICAEQSKSVYNRKQLSLAKGGLRKKLKKELDKEFITSIKYEGYTFSIDNDGDICFIPRGEKTGKLANRKAKKIKDITPRIMDKIITKYEEKNKVVSQDDIDNQNIKEAEETTEEKLNKRVENFDFGNGEKEYSFSLEYLEPRERIKPFLRKRRKGKSYEFSISSEINGEIVRHIIKNTNQDDLRNFRSRGLKKDAEEFEEKFAIEKIKGDSINLENSDTLNNNKNESAENSTENFDSKKGAREFTIEKYPGIILSAKIGFATSYEAHKKNLKSIYLRSSGGRIHTEFPTNLEAGQEKLISPEDLIQQAKKHMYGVISKSEEYYESKGNTYDFDTHIKEGDYRLQRTLIGFDGYEYACYKNHEKSSWLRKKISGRNISNIIVRRNRNNPQDIITGNPTKAHSDKTSQGKMTELVMNFNKLQNRKDKAAEDKISERTQKSD